MEKELHNRPFGLSLSKAAPRMVRQAHHERTKDIYVVHYLCKPQYVPPMARNPFVARNWAAP